MIVDVQNDFCPEGALAVPDGDQIIPVLNQYIQIFSSHDLPVFASRDWHPKVTKHFKLYGGLWPEHCVKDTKGAEFHRDLKLPKNTIVISKGMNPKEDSYSAFQGTDKGGMDFCEILKKHEITDLYVGGLATDYCVKSSVLDACQNGLQVYVLVDAIMGVNIKAGDSPAALDKMVKSGAKKVTLLQLQNQFS